MLKRWLRVARPDDWTGKLARVAVVLVTCVFLLAALAGSLPDRWLAWAGGHAWELRACLAIGVLFLSRWLAVLVYAVLPATPVLVAGRLRWRVRGQRMSARTRELRGIDVERRPEPDHEVFVIELENGTRYDLCPVHWRGAERIYAALKRKLS